jgi:hypothetical protein
MDKDLCDKLKALLDLIKAILEDLKKDAAAAKKTEPLLDDPWFFWMLLSFAWHESAMLTSRTQIGGGPGSGLTQYESARAIEVVDHILSTPEPWTKNLAEAASAAGKSPVTREDMKSALEAYSAEMNKREKKDKYRWPGATGNTDPKHTKLPDTKSERLRYWLLNSDAFSIKFSAIDQLRSHSGIPTKTEMDKGGVKLGSAAAGEVLSKYWADNWNRNDDLKAREAARKEFLVHYEELLKALKKCGLQGSVPGLK